MKHLFTRSLIPYVIGIFILIAITGGILTVIVDNYIMLGSVMAIEFVVLILLFLHFFHKYIKPIHKASRTVNELVKGNYRARIHHPFNGSIGELSRQINVLARNLSELSLTEQIQAEQLYTVIDNTESGLVLIDEKGYIHLVNRKFLSIFGGNQRDYVGYLYYDVLNKDEIHETVQHTFLYEKNIKSFFILNKNSKKMYIETVGAPIFNERNIIMGTVLAFYDITDLKKLEVMRKDFVANVSHELKTPITSISGFAETLLEEDMIDGEVNRQFIKIIFDESKRLQALIDDLLTLSKLEKHGYKLNLSTVNLTKVVNEIIPTFNHAIDEKKLNLSIELVDEIILTADRDKLKQIIINLLANAINYTPEHGEVILRASEGDHQVFIQVIDTGIGIPEDTISRIFERFYRVDKARSRNTGGTGLGLAIVKHIVELHDGKVSVESELNKGSTFTVTLPKHEKNK